MNSSIQSSFTPKIKKCFLYLSYGSITLLGMLVLLWIIASPEVPIILKGVLGLFVFLCLFYSFYFLSYPFMAKIEFSSQGITYSQPLCFTFCNWNEVSRLFFTKDQIHLLYNDAVLKRQHPLYRILIAQSTIPIHFFAERFDRPVDWENNQLLIQLSNHYPDLVREVIEKLS